MPCVTALALRQRGFSLDATYFFFFVSTRAPSRSGSSRILEGAFLRNFCDLHQRDWERVASINVPWNNQRRTLKGAGWQRHLGGGMNLRCVSRESTTYERGRSGACIERGGLHPHDDAAAKLRVPIAVSKGRADTHKYTISVLILHHACWRAVTKVR